MKERNYKRLCFSERIIIETLLNEKRSKSYISNQLNRSRSTISREINKWVQMPRDKYDAKLAHLYATDENENKRNLDKISTFPKLKIQVYRGLLKRLSPEAISGRLAKEYPGNPEMQISHEAIYTHIYAHPQARLNRKLINLLTHKKTRRNRPNRASKRGSRIKDRIGIEQRPKYINQRQEVGHWEGDLIVGPKQKSYMGTLVERKLRYTLLVKLSSKKANEVQLAFAERLNQLPEYMRRSMTYDNGVEMAQHKELAKSTGMDIYFANPYHSWERGTNENMNGVIRRFFPKSTDFNNISFEQIMQLEKDLNDRPRKVIGYATPKEKLLETLKNNTDGGGGLKSGNKSLQIYSRF
jgi:transposase, IS30 family